MMWKIHFDKKELEALFYKDPQYKLIEVQLTKKIISEIFKLVTGFFWAEGGGEAQKIRVESFDPSLAMKTQANVF